MDIVLNSLKGRNLFGIYYDFFAFPNGTFGVLIVESSAQGAEGVVYIAMIRGMIQTLLKQSFNPTEITKTLNELLIKDKIDEIYALSFLSFKSQENTFSYLACGYGNLWKIPANTNHIIPIQNKNLALGIDPDAQFVETVVPWTTDDCLILGSFIPDIEEAFFESIIHDHSTGQTSQQMIDAILRKIKLSSKPSHSRTLSLIGIHRK